MPWCGWGGGGRINYFTLPATADTQQMAMLTPLQSNLYNVLDSVFLKTVNEKIASDPRKDRDILETFIGARICCIPAY